MAGLKGKGSELAVAPTRTGGAFSAHFDKVLGLDEVLQRPWYTVDVPLFSKHDVARVVRPLAVTPVYEALAMELAETPDLQEKLADSVAAGQWARNYMENEVVKREPLGTVFPLGLYLDKVQYKKRDSTLGIWAINCFTHRRHLMACIPTSQTCQCGCNGWCSLFPVLAFVEWSFAAAADGHYPLQRHDGPWPVDSASLSLAGQPLGFRAVVVIIKGDWSEFQSTLSFRAWNHVAHPCFKCFATGGPDGTIQQHTGLSPVSSPGTLKSYNDLEVACAACEVTVRISNPTALSNLVSRLGYDRRKVGHHGRVVLVDLPQHGLLRNDRLEPSFLHMDIVAVDSCTTFPMHLTFWRQGARSMCTHRNPLWSRRSGLLPELICVDELHTLHLGTFQDFSLAVLWQMLDYDAFDMRGGMSDGEYRPLAFMRLRGELFRWYSLQKQEGRTVHELQDFRLSWLGTADRPALSVVKAAESGSLMEFCAYAASRYQDRLPGGRALVGCGECLVRYLSLTRASPLVLTRKTLQGIADSFARFLTLRQDAGIAWKPKAHLMVHMPQDAAFFGNPYLNGTWVDESLNSKLAVVAQSAHISVWSQRIMACFGHAAGPTAQAARSSKRRPS